MEELRMPRKERSNLGLGGISGFGMSIALAQISYPASVEKARRLRAAPGWCGARPSFFSVHLRAGTATEFRNKSPSENRRL